MRGSPVLWLALTCGCTTVGSSALPTRSAMAPATEPVAVRLNSDPANAEELGIVEAHGRRPAASLQQLLTEVTSRAASLGGDVVRIDAFATRYETVTEPYTYDCGTTETHTESRTVTRTGPTGSMTTTTESVPVTRHVQKTCNGVRQVEAATLTLRGRAFRARKDLP